MDNNTLRLLRALNGYAQKEIAGVLNIRQNMYSRLEKNPKNITAQQAKKLSKFYKVDLEDLLSDKILVVTMGKAMNDNHQSSNASEIALLKDQLAYLRQQNLELLKLLGQKKITIRKRNR